MSDDLVALKILVVSDSASERDALRDAAAQGSVLIDVAEVDRIDDASRVCSALTEGQVDAVFVDSRMTHEARQIVLNAARSAPTKPLVISIGAADHSASRLAAEGFSVDGLLLKPIEPGEAQTLLGSCMRARLPRRVLVVDDFITVRSVIRKVLQSSRYRLEVDEAGDGTAALAAAAKQKFDIVLLDCNMPGIDGFTTLSTFLSSHADTKIVMVTASNDTRNADKARAAGAHDVLCKPFYAKDIDSVMNRLHGLIPPKRNPTGGTAGR